MNRPDAPPARRLGLLDSARTWWKGESASHGPIIATRQLVGTIWKFVRDSSPQRRRQLYGDADYDWDYRVNTTAAAVSWRNRLLGTFHSPYQPTEPALFHEMIRTLHRQCRIDFRDFIFIDLGSGKGRTLLMASDYPFRRIVGVELLPDLHWIAHDNLAKYRSDSQKCFALESICADATEFGFPLEPVVLFLFNPLPEAGLRRAITNLERSLQKHPRPVFVLYHNPLLESVLVQTNSFRRVAGTHQYAIYEYGTNG